MSINVFDNNKNIQELTYSNFKFRNNINKLAVDKKKLKNGGIIFFYQHWCPHCQKIFHHLLSKM